MPNEDLLNSTVTAIENAEFVWNQNVWASSNRVDSRRVIAFKDLPHECGTAYCFAGWVCSLKRENLYVADHYDGDSFRVADMFIATEEDKEMNWLPHSDEDITLYHRAVKDDNGNVQFVPYDGMMIRADNAAEKDLEISQSQASILFEGSNNLHEIKRLVEGIINGESYEDEDDIDEEDFEDGYDG